MTAEGQPRRISRRVLVGEALAIAGGVAAAKFLPGVLRGSDSRTTSTSGTETKIAPTDFDRMRESLGKAGFAEGDLAKLTRITGDLEKAGSKLGNLVSVYEADKLPDGTPRLLAARRAQFGNLDVTPLLDNVTKTEREFWENQIPFVRHAKTLDSIKSEVIAVQNGPAREMVAARLRVADPFKEGSAFAPFVEKGILPANGVKISEVPPSPRVAFHKRFYDMPKARTAVEQVASQMPHVGEVNVYLLPTSPDFLGLGGRFSEDGKPAPQELKTFPDIAPVVGEGRTLVVLAVDSLSLPHAAVHEFSHEDSPFDNAGNVVRYLGESTPALMQKCLAVTAEGEWTMTVIDPKVVFSDKMKRVEGSLLPEIDGKPVTPEDIKLAKAKMHIEWFILGSQVFGKDLLDTSFIDTFAKSTPTTPYYYGSFAFGQADRTMVNFANMEKDRLDQLAAASPLWAFAVSKLRENAAILTDFESMNDASGNPYEGGTTLLPFPKNPKTVWQSLPTYANAFLVEAVLRNNREVIDKIPSDKLRGVVQKIFNHQQSVLSEMAAEHLAYSVTIKPYIQQVDRDPGSAYLAALDTELKKNSR